MGRGLRRPERIARVRGFEIVVGAERALPAALALTHGDDAERIEAPGDRGLDARFVLDVRRHGAEQRRLRLIGAVRAAEPLDDSIGLPAGFQRLVHGEALILRAEVRVMGPAGAARIGEDENALLVVLKGQGFGQIRRRGAGLDCEPSMPSRPVLR